MYNIDEECAKIVRDMDEFHREMMSTIEDTEPEFSIKELYRHLNNSFQRQAEILIKLAYYEIALSLTVLTLLTPLCAAIHIGGATRIYLITSSAFLCIAILLGAVSLSISIYFERQKHMALINQLKKLKLGEDGDSQLYGGKIWPLYACGIVGGVCFLLGVLSLSGALFQILLS